ncbi:uncharacterized protein LJ206_001112 [Theristicus caerulescens]
MGAQDSATRTPVPGAPLKLLPTRLGASAREGIDRGEEKPAPRGSPKGTRGPRASAPGSPRGGWAKEAAGEPPTAARIPGRRGDRGAGAPWQEGARLAALARPHRKPPRAGKRRAPLRRAGWQAPRRGEGRGGGERGEKRGWGGYGLALSGACGPALRRAGPGAPPSGPARPARRHGLWRAINSRWRPAPSASPPPRAPPFCLLLQTLSEPPSAGPGAWHRPRPPPPGPATTPLRFRSPHAVAPAAQGRAGRAEPAGPGPAARSFAGALARPSCGLLGACAAAWCGQGKARAGPGGGAQPRGCLPCGWRAAALASARPLSARLGRARRRRRLRRGGRAGGEGGAELGAEWKRPSSPGRARRQHVTSLPERDPGKGGRERAAAAARRLGPAACRGRGRRAGRGPLPGEASRRGKELLLIYERRILKFSRHQKLHVMSNLMEMRRMEEAKGTRAEKDDGRFIINSKIPFQVSARCLANSSMLRNTARFLKPSLLYC